jgi:nitrite reductase (NADH) small subunit
MTAVFLGTWTDVCAVDDLLPGRGVAALVDGVPVAVFLLEDHRVFALSNRDPWSGANVMARGIVGSLGDQVVVASPMYKHHVDLTTGIGVEDPAVTVPVFTARVVAGRVQIGPRP